jgi:hypothetical protein
VEPAAIDWLPAATVAALGIVALQRLHRTLETLSWIQAAASARCRSASQGYVELTGTARNIPGPPIVAPLSRRDCVWYAYQSRGQARDDDGLIWRESGRSDALFHLEDASGRCIIDPDGATIYAPHDETWFGDTRRPTLPSFGWKLEWMGWLFRGMYYHERRIEAGDRLYALGVFESLHEAHRNTLEHETAAILAAWKRDPRRMTAIDSNGDGRVDSDEWEAAREAALRQAALKLHAEGDSPQPLHLLRKPRNRRQPFIIAGCDEATLRRRLRLRAMLHAGTFVCATGAVFLLLPH